MLLDLMAVGIVGFFTVIGALSGALNQLAHLAAVVGAGVLARPLGAILAPHVREARPMPEALAALSGSVIAFFVVYVALFLAGRVAARTLTSNKELKAVDRGAGAVLALTKTALMLWVLLSALVFADAVRVPGGARFSPGASYAAALAREYNFFSMWDDEPAAKGEETPPPK